MLLCNILCRGLQLGLVFQSGALFDSLTVGENVGFLLYEHSKLPTERIKVGVSQKLLLAPCCCIRTQNNSITLRLVYFCCWFSN